MANAEWHLETFNEVLDVEAVPPEALAEKMAKFYCQEKPKGSEKRSSHCVDYHRNTLKNIRAAINRHISDIGRQIDIVHDKLFKKCSKRFSAQCLRATSIQAMNDAGFEARQIMYMSGHRNEASIQSYNRECSTYQNKSPSYPLSCIGKSTAPPQGVLPVIGSRSMT
ncbi:uncharacterized protein [Haliotis cracherodii]|uniref:uncharacterized protein n=1 Tax=Haliotis cracherodii TaxID=6455 RepID=UPI0039ED46F8